MSQDDTTVIDTFLASGELSGSDCSDSEDVLIVGDNTTSLSTGSRPFDRISTKRGRQKQGSQMRQRIEQALARMKYRTGVHTAAVFINESKNTYYFSTAGGGNYFKFTQLVAALEREKLNASDKKKTTVSVNLEDTLKRFRGTVEKPGERYMVKVGQCMEELDIDQDLLSRVHDKYEDSLVGEPDLDVALALKQVIQDALEDIAENGFTRASKKRKR